MLILLIEDSVEFVIDYTKVGVPIDYMHSMAFVFPFVIHSKPNLVL